MSNEIAAWILLFASIVAMFFASKALVRVLKSNNPAEFTKAGKVGTLIYIGVGIAGGLLTFTVCSYKLFLS